MMMCLGFISSASRTHGLMNLMLHFPLPHGSCILVHKTFFLFCKLFCTWAFCARLELSGVASPCHFLGRGLDEMRGPQREASRAPKRNRPPYV